MIDHLLIIDDEEINNFLMGELLSEFEEVKKSKFFMNGWEALQYLEEAKNKNDFPNLILVDLNMPQMDGYEFVEHFESKFLDNFPNTEIVVLSNSMRISDKEKSLRYTSVNQYINKPLDEIRLKEIIQNMNS